MMAPIGAASMALAELKSLKSAGGARGPPYCATPFSVFREFPRVGPGHLRISLFCVGKTVYQIPRGGPCLSEDALALLLYRITVVPRLKLQAVHCFLILLSPWNSCCGPIRTMMFRTVKLRPGPE